MVKLRGINVYPTAIAAMIAEIDGVTGEYVCRLERRADGADHLVVVVEHAAPSAAVAERVAELVTSRVGVKVGAEAVPAGATAELTGLTVRQKPTRLVDVR
jgi:phenylacetate-CoA ligase